MREDGHVVTNSDLDDRHVFQSIRVPAVRKRRHTFTERTQDGRRLGDGVLLEGIAARQHEHHDGPGQILAEKHRRCDRNGREMIRTEFSAQRTPDQPHDDRESAGCEHEKERRVAPQCREVEGVTRRHMDGDSNQREQCDPKVFVLCQGCADFSEARLTHVTIVARVRDVRLPFSSA